MTGTVLGEKALGDSNALMDLPIQSSIETYSKEMVSGGGGVRGD